MFIHLGIVGVKNGNQALILFQLPAQRVILWMIRFSSLMHLLVSSFDFEYCQYFLWWISLSLVHDFGLYMDLLVRYLIYDCSHNYNYIMINKITYKYKNIIIII